MTWWNNNLISECLAHKFELWGQLEKITNSMLGWQLKSTLSPPPMFLINVLIDHYRWLLSPHSNDIFRQPTLKTTFVQLTPVINSYNHIWWQLRQNPPTMIINFSGKLWQSPQASNSNDHLERPTLLIISSD